MPYFRMGTISLVCLVALWITPGSAQDKFTMGMGGST
jgi:hypothetical protein